MSFVEIIREFFLMIKTFLFKKKVCKTINHNIEPVVYKKENIQIVE